MYKSLLNLQNLTCFFYSTTPKILFKDLKKFLKNRIYVGHMPTKQHEKHPLLGAHGLCQDGQTLLLHFYQVQFILHGITGNDDHTNNNNKYTQLHQTLNKSGSELKQVKPTEKEKLDRNCFYIVHILQYYVLNCATNNVANTKKMPSGIYKTDCQVNTKDNSKFDVGRINSIFRGESIVYYALFHYPLFIICHPLTLILLVSPHSHHVNIWNTPYLITHVSTYAGTLQLPTTTSSIRKHP